ncbi:MAG: TetR/AcrR family transcriptional regulator [Candidatus Hydrogenedentes bacterium]|nr:TetR/AcrR family transcriptional regulator [Candidatus Hydrogenedentota bacterium]
MTSHRTKEERREQIVLAAITCFAEKGYYEASMDVIAAEANLSKGSLYWHFKSKRELFQSLVERWLQEFTDCLGTAFEGTATASEKLRMMIDAVKRNAAAQPELARAQLEFYVLAVRDEEFKAWLHENYAADIQFLESILRQGMENGEFREVPVDSVARMIMAYLDGALLHREINDPEATASTILDEVADTLTALLKV